MQTAEIVGVGIDVVEIATMAGARFKQRLAEYFLTPREIAAIPWGVKEVEYLASRFAVKEAVIKAFPHFLSPFDVVVTKDARGKPGVRFLSANHKQYAAQVSLTHTQNIAAAVAIVTSVQ